jgi:hypothetical protein
MKKNLSGKIVCLFLGGGGGERDRARSKAKPLSLLQTKKIFFLILIPSNLSF